MTKFQNALHVECKSCGHTSAQHRLTPTGNFYCLKLNDVGWDKYAYPRSNRAGVVDLTRIVYTCAVKYLRKSALPQGLGTYVNAMLKSPVGDAT